MRATLLITIIAAGGLLLAQDGAYREEIITPHWIERHSHAEGALDALFLVNDLARREPDELGQRFDIEVRKVRTLRGSNAYKNVFDLDAFAAQLGTDPDVLVVSAAKVWKDLGPKGIESTTEWVKNGGRLVVFTRSAPERELEEMGLEAGELVSLTDAVGAGLDLEPTFPGKFRDSFAVAQTEVGMGAITLARPFDRAYVRFNALFPKLGSWDDPEIARETGYLLANRIIRRAAGKTDGDLPNIEAKPEAGGVQISGELESGELQIQVRSASGQLLTEATATRLPISLPVQSRGKFSLILDWRNPDGQRLGINTVSVDLGEPEPFEVAVLPAPLPRNAPISLEWTPIRDHADWQVEAEIYDADRNLLRLANAPARAGKLTIQPWQTHQLTHEVRLILTGPNERPESISPGVTKQKTHVRGSRTILAEQFKRLHLDADPEADRRQWTTLAWGDENSHLAERWRGHRLRELGLNATAPIGRNVDSNRLAAATGLRVVPTNVFVPKNRYNEKRFDEEQSKTWLTEFATGVQPLSPLGYSFADEPTQSVILPWLDKGANVLASADPGARFGYCGVWPGAYSPELMRKSGYLGLYSPRHLYNLNIWLGIERDIYRSFRSPDGIVTIWTHYAPWADHEPYSRTVPWVWLFDGMDGVGYFKSAGMMFGILDGDLRSTHETRWWSEEIRELNAGVAEQVKRMRRDVGSVRILFGGNLKAVDPWARAMNELSIPYQFLDANQLRTEYLEGVRLLIAVDGGELGEPIEAFVRRGGVLIGGGGLASTLENSADRFEAIFGFAPDSMAADATSDFAGIRASVENLEGLTTGECLPAGGEGWKTLGGAASIPERLKTIAGSSAIRMGSDGKAIYLALKPDVASVKRWLPILLGQAGISEPKIWLANEDRVYVTRYSDGVAQLVGLVPDYHRIAPAEQIREIAPNPRDSEDNPQKEQIGYFQHGPQRWAPVEAKLDFGETKHAYDVRRGAYLGEISERSWPIQPGRPELLALLPYAPPQLKLEIAGQAQAGTDLEFEVALSSKQPFADHVFRAELVDLSGNAVPGAFANLHAESGVASGRFSIPHGLEPGDFRLVVRDILTGAKTESRLTACEAEKVATAPLSPREFRVERHPVDWPAGEWEPIPEDLSVADATPATAKVKSLQRKVIHYGKHSGNEHLMSGFTIGNGLRTYEMKYLVCCDSKILDKGPPQRVRGLNGSGLGMNKPHGHLWYYNSYIKVYLGDREGEMVLDYELAKIEELSDDTTARVRLTWEAPSATAWLEYVMIPGHEGLFQQLSIEPHDGKPLTKTTVNLISYPAGFGKGGKPFYEIAQEHQEWLLMGDAVRDRDFYESGKGSAGLLIRPEEWAEVKYNARPLLTAERPDADAGKPWRLHWVTWMFPERGNAAAKAYMQTNSEATATKLSELFAKP